MVERLKLGSYIIDSDTNGSTTTGATLLIEDPNNPKYSLVKPSFTPRSTAVGFVIHIQASNLLDLKNRVQDVKAKVLEPLGDLIYEDSDSDNELLALKLSNGNYSSAKGEIKSQYGELNCILSCSIIYSKNLDAHGTGSLNDIGNPENLVGAIEFEFERTTHGQITSLLNATFRSTNTLSSREAALNWIENVKNRTTEDSPAWMPSRGELRVVNDTVQFIPDSDDGAIKENCLASIAFQEIPSDLTNLSEKISGLTATTNVSPRQLNNRAHEAALLDITISGIIQTRTEGNQTFDNNQSAVDTITNDELHTALELIKQKAIIRLDLSFTDNQEISRKINREIDTGNIPFVINLVSGVGNILEWDEDISYQATSGSTFVDDLAGGRTRYDKPGVGDAFLIHNLRVVTHSSTINYSLPPGASKDEWVLVNTLENTPKPISTSTISKNETPVTLYIHNWKKTYAYQRGPNGKINGPSSIKSILNLEK